MEKTRQKYQLPYLSLEYSVDTDVFNSKFNLEYKTLITQEMLKKGYLAANSVYVSTEHNPNILEGYEMALDNVFELIAECENKGSVNKLLEGPICNTSFQD